MLRILLPTCLWLGLGLGLELRVLWANYAQPGVARQRQPLGLLRLLRVKLMRVLRLLGLLRGEPMRLLRLLGKLLLGKLGKLGRLLRWLWGLRGRLRFCRLLPGRRLLWGQLRNLLSKHTWL